MINTEGNPRRYEARQQAWRAKPDSLFQTLLNFRNVSSVKAKLTGHKTVAYNLKYCKHSEVWIAVAISIQKQRR